MINTKNEPENDSQDHHAGNPLKAASIGFRRFMTSIFLISGHLNLVAETTG
jgi:hypothetical protein